MFTLFRALDSEAAYHIYPSCLSGRGYGYPLWRPEPHDTGEPQIGDVGYMREGSFVRLFNINISAAPYRVKGWHPQFDIEEPPSLNVFRVASYPASLMAGQLRSRGVEEIGIHGKLAGGTPFGASAGLSGGYSCREVHGALLVLKSHADAESLYDNRALEEYMIREHHKWHAYAVDDVGHRVKLEDVVLVSGWVKAPADWATAAFSNTSSTESLSVTSQLGQLFGLGLSGKRRTAYSGPRMERQGATYPQVADANAPRNQCLFVKRYKIKKRVSIVRVLQAGAGYDNQGPSGGGDDDVESSAVRSGDPDVVPFDKLFGEWEDTTVEPLDILLDYILEISNADYALARDEDIESILGGNTPTDFSTYLRRAQPPVLVDDRCGRVSKQDLLLRTQAKLEHPRISSGDLARWPGITAEGRAEVASGKVQLPNYAPGKSRGLPKYAFLEFTEPTVTIKTRHCYALSSDGTLLATAWNKLEIVLWRTRDGLRLQCLTDAHSGNITSLAFSMDRRRLASGSRDRTVVIWDVVHGTALLRLEGHSSESFPWFLSFSPNGRVLLSGANDGTVIFWDAYSGSSLSTFALGTAVRAVLFDTSGSYAAVTVTNLVVLFKLGPQIVQRAAIASTSTPRIFDVEFSPNGERILVCAHGEFARVYTTDKGREVLRLDQRGQRARTAAFTPDGGAVMSVTAGERDMRLVVQDAVRGKELLDVDDRNHSEASTLAISPDGTLLVTPYSLGGLIVRDGRSGEWIGKIEGVAQEVVTDVKFLSDSRRVLFTCSTGPIGIVDVADIRRVQLQ
ncbi:WD40 repeat domain-containing protein [Phanerochaete sordida]|uniref:WD40 repeat domain-containing protein n=1 Tax=Phanerochaete sordida TaxID=48140 RepID=A0A9P3GIN4_9APHY|nr:WD40 repeat domain-containing protein [Phanerochaete sordida]